VPDALSNSSGMNSVSHRNRQHDNVMGRAPNGDRVPNGVDFWWDDAPQQEDNCWFDNGEVTSSPPAPILPSSCENTSVGATYPVQSAELLGCAGAIASDRYDPNACPWFRTPPKPSGSQQGAARVAPPLPLAGAASTRPRLTAPLADFCVRTGTTLSCAPFRDRL
jgi:hypothetical protein